MPKFMFQAKTASGQVQMGQLEAADEADARSKLKMRNLTPLKLLMVGGSAAKRSGAAEVGFFEKRVPSKDMQIFTRQFSTLINAGIPVVDSLKMLGEGKRNEMLKEAATQVRLSIEAGKRLGDAMAAIPKVFDRFYINMVRAGEEAGILDNILLRLSTYMEKAEKIKKQVKGALFYPAAILIVAAVVITGILVFVIPKFQEMYKGAGQDLPAITQMVVHMSDFLIHKWYMAIGGAIAIPYFIGSWAGTNEGKDTIDRVMIKMPLFGELVQKAAVARMTRTLSTLLSSGVGVVEALDIAAKTAGNRVIEDALIRSKESVISGRPLAAPLMKEPLIPDMVTQMIAIGEQSGTLDTMLGKIADFYEDDVENAVKALTSLIEPIMMVFLGGIIAVLVLAMYLPIFKMADVVTGGAGG
jgi:type IV pilus assembly protein PilC